MSMEQERTYAESLSETPSVLRYSDLIKVGTPIADTQIHTLIPSNGGTFSPNQQIRIPFNIPTDSFANLKGAYLNYTITNKSTGGVDSLADLYFDPVIGGVSVIDTWRVVSGTGALLEEIQHYNVIYGICADMVSEDHRQTHLAVMERSSNDPTGPGVGSLSIAVTAGGDINDANQRGYNLIPKDGNQVISHKPMSGLFNADRLAPLGFATGTSYVEITLPSVNNPFVVDKTANGTAIVPDWSVSNVELVVPVLRMGSEFNASFRQLLSAGVPINWHSTSWHNVQSSLAQGTSQITNTVSARKRSVKSIISCIRRTADLSSKLVDSNTARRSGAITSWNYEVGGIQYPAKDIKQNKNLALTAGSRNMGESFAQLMNCFANLGNIYTGTCISQDTFISTNDLTVASKIAYGLDLESYGHSDVQSGKNLANQGLPIVFNATIDKSTSFLNDDDTTGIVDTFLMYDVIYTLDGVSGTISASS
jgi:hypothetical protein